MQAMSPPSAFPHLQNSGIPSMESTSSVNPHGISWKNPGMSSPKERDQYLTGDHERAIKAIDRLVLANKLEGHKHILDVGSGSGLTTFYIWLKALESTILGVDTKENTEFATKYSCLSNNKVSFKEILSPLVLPKADVTRGWDLILGLALFSWIPKDLHATVLKAMYDVLSPYGEILVRTEAVGHRPYRDAMQTVMGREPWASLFLDYNAPFSDQTVEGFEASLKEAGYVNSEVELINDELNFVDKSAMINYFMQWLPPLEKIISTDPAETYSLRYNFTREVIDQYCLDIKNDGTKIPLIFPAIYAAAKKRPEKALGFIKI